MHPLFDDDSVLTQILDWTAISVVVTTLMGWLPSVAAGFSIVWTVIRIIESKTFQSIWGWIRRAVH